MEGTTEEVVIPTSSSCSHLQPHAACNSPSPTVYPSGTNEVHRASRFPVEVLQPDCLPQIRGRPTQPPSPLSPPTFPSVHNDVNDKSRAHVKNLS